MWDKCAQSHVRWLFRLMFALLLDSPTVRLVMTLTTLLPIMSSLHLPLCLFHIQTISNTSVLTLFISHLFMSTMSACEMENQSKALPRIRYCSATAIILLRYKYWCAAYCFFCVFCSCKEPAEDKFQIYCTAVACQVADGSLSGEWGGDIYHVLYEHTPSSEAAPVLHCLVWCVHRCVFLVLCLCVCVFIHYIKMCLSCTRSLPLSHCVIGPCAAVVRETPHWHRLTFHYCIFTEFLTALLPSVNHVSVDQCACMYILYSQCLRDVILLTSLHSTE